MNKSKNSKRVKLIRNFISLALVGLFGIIVAVNWQQMRSGFAVLESVSVWWLVLGIFLYALTQLFGATSYFSLALRKVSWRDLYIVEWASAGINRLLPAGAGSMGIHGLYLLKRKHSVAETVAVVALNNILSITTHFVLLALVFLLVPHHIKTQSFALPRDTQYFVFAAVLLVGLFLGIPTIRKVFRKFVSDVSDAFKKYRAKKKAVLASTLAVLCLTATNTVLLWSMMTAVGLELGVIVAFIVFSIGVAFGALFPTPGGLGGVEAGLVAALMLFTVPSATAIAVAILFRFVTFWVPLVLGNIVFLTVRNKNYF